MARGEIGIMNLFNRLGPEGALELIQQMAKGRLNAGGFNPSFGRVAREEAEATSGRSGGLNLPNPLETLAAAAKRQEIIRSMSQPTTGGSTSASGLGPLAGGSLGGGAKAGGPLGLSFGNDALRGSLPRATLQDKVRADEERRRETRRKDLEEALLQLQVDRGERGLQLDRREDRRRSMELNSKLRQREQAMALLQSLFGGGGSSSPFGKPL